MSWKTESQSSYYGNHPKHCFFCLFVFYSASKLNELTRVKIGMKQETFQVYEPPPPLSLGCVL